MYFGYRAACSALTANSFITIWVDPSAPGAARGATQINRLVYGDCAEGGMMGTICMIGIAGGRTISGYLVSQTISRQP